MYFINMFKIKKSFNILIISCLFPFLANCQIKKGKWTNKDKGTVIVKYDNIGLYPNDTTNTGISNAKLIYIGVKFFEFSGDSVKKIDGKIKINKKEYFVYDSTNFADSEGYKNSSNYFSIPAQEGEYIFIAYGNNEYYPVKSEKYYLNPGTSYRFDFYLIRKNELKKSKK